MKPLFGSGIMSPKVSATTALFGKRLAACRLAARFEYAEDFAKAIGVHPARYRMYERGEREPPQELLVLMARRLGTSIDFLLGLKQQ